jgi:prevent-host-death family protein
VGDRHERGPRADGVGDVPQGHGAHRRPALARVQQRAEQPGVLLIRGDHLVARAERHPGQHAPQAVRRRRRQRDLLGGRPDEARVRVAEILLQPHAGLEVLREAAPGLLRGERLARSPRRGGGQRAVRAAVEIGDAFEHGELRPQGCRIHPRQASAASLCYIVTHMSDTVGVRELRQNLSKYLDRVKAGEDLIVTERGRAVARLVPSTSNAYAELASRFGATVPVERLEAIAARLSPPRAPAGTTDAFLAEDRDDPFR